MLILTIVKINSVINLRKTFWFWSGEMKKLLYMISVPILLVILNCQLCLAQGVARPTMILEEKVFDAKDVSEGKVIAHAYKVINTGDSPLEISKVSTG